MGQGKGQVKPPAEYAEFPKFKRIVNDLFVHYTGAPMQNLRKSMLRRLLAGTPMRQLLQAMKVIRRFCERTLLFDDEALGDACYIL